MYETTLRKFHLVVNVTGAHKIDNSTITTREREDTILDPCPIMPEHHSSRFAFGKSIRLLLEYLTSK